MGHALELIAHRVELRYGLVRFIAWLVPTVGFIGTVYGLGASLYEAGASAEINVQETARALGVGFDCTMVALMQSAVLVFMMHIAQEKEELSVNLSGTYCLRNLINRLYTGRPRREHARRSGDAMKRRNREVNIFNMSLLDILCGTLGAFCFLMLALLPDHLKAKQLQEQIERMSTPAGKNAEARAKKAEQDADEAKRRAEEAEEKAQARRARNRASPTSRCSGTDRRTSISG